MPSTSTLSITQHSPQYWRVTFDNPPINLVDPTMIAAVHSGSPSARLPGIVGRGRTFEYLLGGEDFTGDLAERYGFVNRAVPDAQFAEFVDAFAQRVSRFDPLTLADIKRLVNAASLPADGALTAEMDACAESIARPAWQALIDQALKQGLQQLSNTELNLGDYVGTLPHGGGGSQIG